MEKITIELSNYNIDDSIALIIKKLIDSYPDKTIKEYSEILGISERTLYRYQKSYDIKFKAIKKERKIKEKERKIKEKELAKEKELIDILVSAGYQITKIETQ